MYGGLIATHQRSFEWVKLRTSNFVGTFIASIATKAHENVGNSGRGHSQEVPKIFRAPICRAHCAVIFAIAQLSCFHDITVTMFRTHGHMHARTHGRASNIMPPLTVCGVMV